MAGRRKSIRVLIVDDDPTMRSLVRRAAMQMRMQPWLASSVAEAKELLLQGKRPDLVITDLMLGDGTGSDLVAFLRRAGIAAPAVLVTGSAECLTLVERATFVDVVQKPFRLSALFDALEVARRNVRPRHRSDVLERPVNDETADIVSMSGEAESLMADPPSNENQAPVHHRASGEDEPR